MKLPLHNTVTCRVQEVFVYWLLKRSGPHCSCFHHKKYICNKSMCFCKMSYCLLNISKCFSDMSVSLVCLKMSLWNFKWCLWQVVYFYLFNIRVSLIHIKVSLWHMRVSVASQYDKEGYLWLDYYTKNQHDVRDWIEKKFIST